MRGFFIVYGAEGGTRTRMELPPSVFETDVYANSTTSARIKGAFLSIHLLRYFLASLCGVLEDTSAGALKMPCI